MLRKKWEVKNKKRTKKQNKKPITKNSPRKKQQAQEKHTALIIALLFCLSLLAVTALTSLTANTKLAEKDQTNKLIAKELQKAKQKNLDTSDKLEKLKSKEDKPFFYTTQEIEFKSPNTIIKVDPKTGDSYSIFTQPKSKQPNKYEIFAQPQIQYNGTIYIKITTQEEPNKLDIRAFNETTKTLSPGNLLENLNASKYNTLLSPTENYLAIATDTSIIIIDLLTEQRKEFKNTNTLTTYIEEEQINNILKATLAWETPTVIKTTVYEKTKPPNKRKVIDTKQFQAK